MQGWSLGHTALALGLEMTREEKGLMADFLRSRANVTLMPYLKVCGGSVWLLVRGVR